MPKLPVTVVIPTKNEEKNLPQCIEKLGDFAAIWVVDSGSTDRTAAIAREANARFIEFDWNGKFPKKRNWVLLNENFDTQWVLFLDADEHISEEFVRELRKTLSDAGDFDGYWLNYTTHFMGGILWRGIPQRKLALIKVGAGLYERIEEDRWSHLDMEVHEHPQLNGRIGEIAARIDHRDFRGIEHFIDRHNAYSTWEAHRWQNISTGTADQRAKLTPRQKRKYANLAKWWWAPAYFVMTYFFKRGFLDGRRGFDYAFLKMVYFHNIRLKIREMQSGG